MYGINFNAKPLMLCPLYFKEWLRVDGNRLNLVGVAESEAERIAMEQNIANGTRTWRIVIRETPRGNKWYGFYA